MPTISVPEVLRPSLERIAGMSDSEFQETLEVVATLRPHIKPEVMADNVKQGQPADLSEIVRTLMNLSITRFRSDIPLEGFVEGVAGSLRFPKDQDAKPKRKAFADRLKLLLSTESLVLSGRAFDIQHEYEKVFRSARIVTDIRPVFSEAGTEALGAMIVHNLSIAYFEDGDYKETVFAMDDSDIAKFKKIIERAETKGRICEQAIDKAGLRYFESK